MRLDNYRHGEKEALIKEKWEEKTTFYDYLYFPLLLWQKSRQWPTKCLKAHCSSFVLADALFAQGMY